MYWVLDVKNDTNQAMQTRDYWPAAYSNANDPATDNDSIQMEELGPDEERNHGGSFAAPESLPPNGQMQNGGFLRGPLAQNLPLDPAPIPQAHPQVTGSFEDPHPREQSLKDFKNFLFETDGCWTRGNWTDLFATSFSWMLLDFTFYLLGVNSSRLVPNMFNEQLVQGPYSRLISNEWHTLVATSIGAVIGGIIAIKIMNNFSRKKIQMWCFLALAALFVVVGVLYILLLNTNGSAVIVAVYVLCQLLFNVGEFQPASFRNQPPLTILYSPGPNTTTFIVSPFTLDNSYPTLTTPLDPSGSFPNPLPLHLPWHIRCEREIRLRPRPNRHHKVS